MKPSILPRHPKRCAAFTLIEVMVVVIITGIMGYLLVSNMQSAKRTGEESEMKAKAANIQVAMGSFLADQSIRGAVTAWTGKSDDERYQKFLRPYLQYSADSLTNLSVEGYTIVLPSDPRQRVKLLDPEGKEIEFQ